MTALRPNTARSLLTVATATLLPAACQVQTPGNAGLGMPDPGVTARPPTDDLGETGMLAPGAGGTNRTLPAGLPSVGASSNDLARHADILHRANTRGIIPVICCMR